MLREIAKSVYWLCQNLLRKIVGTKFDTLKWQNEVSGDDYLRFSPSQNHPHRQWLVKQILADDSKFASILDFGCGPADNLEILRLNNFQGNYHGIDVNQGIINNAKERFKTDPKSDFAVGNIEMLNSFEPNSFDIVITDAVLLYIGPDQIEEFIKAALRVSIHGLFLIEMHDDSMSFSGTYTKDGYVRNYRNIPKNLSSNVNVQKIPVDVWSTGRWPKFGHLIRVQ